MDEDQWCLSTLPSRVQQPDTKGTTSIQSPLHNDMVLVWTETATRQAIECDRYFPATFRNELRYRYHSLELLKKKTEELSRRMRRHAPLEKNLKVETKICAILRHSGGKFEQSSTLKIVKFTMKSSFLSSVCIHRSITLIFIEKKYVYRFFSNGKYFVPRFLISISARILVSATN